VIVVNMAVSVAQEVKAGHAIAALSELAAPDARVVRDGEQRQIPAAEVVAGDLLVLAEGDIVPADAGVVDAAALLVDESALTGESVLVDKAAASQEERGDVVSAGTVIVRGRGRAVVTATGAASAMGRVAALMSARPGAHASATAAGWSRPCASGRGGGVVLDCPGDRAGPGPRRGTHGHRRDQPGGRRCP
jgi:P-type Ca2+ transporter type 2C